MEYTEGGCHCSLSRTGLGDEIDIDYCPLHKAAPDLYEACIIACGFLACYEDKAHKEVAQIVRQAIAKAEGK